MYLLDTDVLIWAVRGRREIVDLLEKLANTSSTFVSVISIAEIYQNIFPSEITTTDGLLYRHVILPVNDLIAKQGGLYWQQFVPKLKSLSLADCLIAATAKLEGLSVLTLNSRHFPMTDIRVVKPLGSTVK